MIGPIRFAVAAVLAAGAAPLAAAPAAAQGVNTQFLVAEIKSRTPRCRDVPEYDVVGRVSGVVGGHPTRTVSFVGCFPDLVACQAWRGPVSGRISGRLIQSTCEPR